ncbi:MAG: ankyrin repeat protein 40-like [Gammaproteobacteria bacterium]|nr:ankyrin repeat protein 40-like [Gammaproteobacteria bacterium]
MNVKEAHNQSMLQSIAQRGLFIETSSDERIYSYDDQRGARICYFYVPSATQQQITTPRKSLFSLMEGGSHSFSSPLERLQHRELDGLWSLLIERELMTTQPTLEKNADRFEWEDRLVNSILLVLKCPAARLQQDRQISKMPYEITDLQTSTPFAPGDIAAVLCPRAQLSLVQSIFTSHPVFGVDQTQQSTACSGTLAEQHNEYLDGPDYAKKLQSLIDQQKLTYPFALHIVRLASQRDFLKIPALTKKLSMTDCIANFKSADPAVMLRKAAACGEREDIEYLLPHCDINAQSPTNGQTALHWAIQKNRITNIKALLKHGAKRDIPDKQGKTANNYAAEANINLDEIINGAYDKKIFIIRAKADPSNKILGAMTDFVGRHYRAPGL